MSEKRKRDHDSQEPRAARGCPSVWLPLTPKQRTKFLADIKGWLPGWGEADEDWQWLESLLDTTHWTKLQQREVVKKANRGMGFALDELTGASHHMTDKSVCQWTQMRLQCKTDAPLQTMETVQQSILKTMASSLVAQMEEMRSGAWIDNKQMQQEAHCLFEASKLEED